MMVSQELIYSMVTNQIAFDRCDSNSIDKFERPIDRCCHAHVFKLETLDNVTFT